LGRKVVNERRGEMDLDIAGLFIGHGAGSRDGRRARWLITYSWASWQFCSCSCMTAFVAFVVIYYHHSLPDASYRRVMDAPHRRQTSNTKRAVNSPYITKTHTPPPLPHIYKSAIAT